MSRDLKVSFLATDAKRCVLKTSEIILFSLLGKYFYFQV